MPGSYQARLTVDGKSLTQPFSVRMDPRVKTSTAGLLLQFQLSRQLAQAAIDLGILPDQTAARPLIGQLQQLYSTVQGTDAAPTTQAIAAIRERLATATALIGKGRPQQ